MGKEINKRYAFNISLPPQEVILYADSREEAIRRFTCLTSPLWDVTYGLSLKCTGETEKHDNAVAALLKDYEFLKSHAGMLNPFELGDLKLTEMELEERNVFKKARTCNKTTANKGRRKKGG